jgi:excisionase family DNA binding protein
MGRLMTVNDVHERTRLAVQTIYSMVSAGKVPFGKVGSRLLFIEDDINQWVLVNGIEPKTWLEAGHGEVE